MLAEVSARVAGVDTNITRIEALSSTDDNRGRIDMTIEIGDLKQLEKVVKSLKKVGGVLSVERSAK